MPPRPPPKPWPRLTDDAREPDLIACQLCGEVRPLRLYEECNESDRPDGRYLLACGTCERQRIKPHPRLYSDVDVKPGAIPALCVRCVHRQGLDCRHPDLKANGGQGLKLTLSSPLASGVILCTRGRGCISPPRQATACAGQRHLAVIDGGEV